VFVDKPNTRQRFPDLAPKAHNVKFSVPTYSPRWQFLSGDWDVLEGGGKWIRILNETEADIFEISPGCEGDWNRASPKYMMEVSKVNLDDDPFHALKAHGWMLDAAYGEFVVIPRGGGGIIAVGPMVALVVADAMHSHGTKTPGQFMTGSNYENMSKKIGGPAGEVLRKG